MSPTRTTTIRLPLGLYEEAKDALDHQTSNRSRVSLNDLFVTAIAAYLKMHKRRQIDAAFAGMATDTAYQKQSALLAQEFEQSDWEALQLGGGETERKPAHARRSSR